MPLDPGSRSIIAGGASPYIPLITNNPAFKVAIVPLDGALEQKPRQGSGREEIEKIKIGDVIRGTEISNKRKPQNILGRVLQVNLEKGEVVSYKILSQRGKEHFINPTTADKIDTNGEDPNPMSAPQTQLEAYAPVNRVMLYEQWIVSR